MISFVAGNAAVTTHCKSLFTEISMDFVFAFKAAVSKSTRKEIGTVRMMSRVVIPIDFEIGNKGNEIGKRNDRK